MADLQISVIYRSIWFHRAFWFTELFDIPSSVLWFHRASGFTDLFDSQNAGIYRVLFCTLFGVYSALSYRSLWFKKLFVIQSSVVYRIVCHTELSLLQSSLVYSTLSLIELHGLQNYLFHRALGFIECCLVYCLGFTLLLHTELYH